MDSNQALEVLQYLKEKRGRPIYKKDLNTIGIKEDLTPLINEGLVYPYKDALFLTQHGDAVLKSAKSTSPYHAIRKYHEGITPRNREGNADVNKKWTAHFLNALSQFEKNHPEMKDLFEMIGTDIKEKIGQWHDSKEFLKDVQAIFNKWHFGTYPELSYGPHDNYTVPEVLNSVEHAMAESLTRLEQNSKRLKASFVDPKQYRQVYDVVENAVSQNQSLIDAAIEAKLGGYKKGAILSLELATTEVGHAIMNTPAIKGKVNEKLMKLSLSGMPDAIMQKVKTILPGIFFDVENPEEISTTLNEMIRGANGKEYLNRFLSTARAIDSGRGGSKETGKIVMKKVFTNNNFNGLDFSYVNFDELDVTNCDFSGANLSHSTWSRCEIRRSNFTGADFTDADFLDVDAFQNNIIDATTKFENAALPPSILALLKGENIDLSTIRTKGFIPISKSQMVEKGYRGKEAFDHSYLPTTNQVPAYVLDASGDNFCNYIFASDINNEFSPELFHTMSLHDGSIAYKGKNKADKFLGWIGGKYDRANGRMYVTEMQSDLMQNTRFLDPFNLDEHGRYIGRAIRKLDENGVPMKDAEGKSIFEKNKDGTVKRDKDGYARTNGVNFKKFFEKLPDGTLKSIKSKLENRFNNWQGVFFNSVLREAKRKGARYVYVPTAKFYKSQGHTTAPTQYYDSIVKDYPTTMSKDGHWRIVDLIDHERLLIASINTLNWKEDPMTSLSFHVTGDLDYAYWTTYIEQYIKVYVSTQLQQTPDLGNKEELAKDAYSFMLQSIPREVQQDPDWEDIVKTAEETLQEEGYGKITEVAEFKAPSQDIENVLNFHNTPDEDDEGAVFMDPHGQPIEPDKLQGESQEEVYNPLNALEFGKKDYEVEKQNMIDEYLDALSKARQRGDTAKAEKIRRQIDELVALGSRRFAWQALENEDLMNKAIEMYNSGEYLKYLKPHEHPVKKMRSYSPGDPVIVVKSRQPVKGVHYLISTFHRKGAITMGAYLVLNPQGEVKKALQIKKLSEIPREWRDTIYSISSLETLSWTPISDEQRAAEIIEKKIIPILKKEIRELENDPDVTNVYGEDIEEYKRIAHSLRYHDIEKAMSNYYNMDTAAREYITTKISGDDKIFMMNFFEKAAEYNKFSSNTYKDLSFNYDRERGQQINEYEPNEGQGGALDPLDMQQSYDTDMMNRPEIEHKQKELHNLDWQDRSNQQLWI